VLTNYLESWRSNEKRLLFSNRRGNPHCENKVVQKRLWPILDALSIPRCGMHAFRHTHASMLVSNGASPKVAQAQMRHADVSTTMRAYARHVGPLAIPLDYEWGLGRSNSRLYSAIPAVSPFENNAKSKPTIDPAPYKT
jgi:integrase